MVRPGGRRSVQTAAARSGLLQEHAVGAAASDLASVHLSSALWTVPHRRPLGGRIRCFLTFFGRYEVWRWPGTVPRRGKLPRTIGASGDRRGLGRSGLFRPSPRLLPIGLGLNSMPGRERPGSIGRTSSNRPAGWLSARRVHWRYPYRPGLPRFDFTVANANIWREWRSGLKGRFYEKYRFCRDF